MVAGLSGKWLRPGVRWTRRLASRKCGEQEALWLEDPQACLQHFGAEAIPSRAGLLSLDPGRGTNTLHGLR